MKLSNRILAVCFVLVIIFATFSSGSIDVNYLTHDCSHDNCDVCAMYDLVSIFTNAITITIIINLFIICVKKYGVKYKYRSFKLLPIELKVRMNN